MSPTHLLFNYLICHDILMQVHLCKVHNTVSKCIWLCYNAVQSIIWCMLLTYFFNKWSDPTSSLCAKLGYLRFSNHIYLGQENLRCLCLTRWLANQGWLHWGVGTSQIGCKHYWALFYFSILSFVREKIFDPMKILKIKGQTHSLTRGGKIIFLSYKKRV